MPIEALGLGCTEPELILEALACVPPALLAELRVAGVGLSVHANLNDRREAHLRGFDVRRLRPEEDQVRERADLCEDSFRGYVEVCEEMVRLFGVSYVGGCCGCGPDGIRELVRAFSTEERLTTAASSAKLVGSSSGSLGGCSCSRSGCSSGGGSPAGLTKKPLRVAVLGCGAMGSIYAALFSAAGHSVCAVDVWEAHVRAMQEDGLRVHGASGDRTERVRATTRALDAGPSDLVFVATKAPQAEAAVRDAAQLVRGVEGAFVVLLQNGLPTLSAEQVEAAGLPRGQVLLGVASNFGAAMRGPGEAEHKSMSLVCLGHMGAVLLVFVFY